MCVCVCVCACVRERERERGNNYMYVHIGCSSAYQVMDKPFSVTSWSYTDHMSSWDSAIANHSLPPACCPDQISPNHC